MLINPFENDMEVTSELRANEHIPILFTEGGMLIDVKLQLSNAKSPMLVTEDGIFMEVRLVTQNAKFPMLVTESGIVTISSIVS